MKAVLTTFNSKYIHTSLALNSIRAFSVAHGYNVEIIEHTLTTPLISALSKIYKEQPDIVGIAVYIWNKNISYSLANMIKKVMPNTKVILGGPEVTHDEDVFNHCPSADFIIKGEGEKLFCDFLANNSKTFKNKKTNLEVVEDLSELVFPYDLLEDNIEKRILYYESSRGCPFSCAYCLSGKADKVRFRPYEQVIDDLDRFIKAKVKQVKFVDRTFNINKKHFMPIIEWLSRQETKTNFHFEIKADILDDEVIEFLKRVPKGRFQFEIGIQSIHEKTLKASQRRQDLEKTKSNILKVLEKGNIHIHLDLICGLPYETIEMFEESFNAVYALGADMLQLGFLKLLKGSDFHNKQSEYGYIFMEDPPYEVLQNNYMTYNDLRFLKIVEEVFDYTYNSQKFKETLKYLTNIEKTPYQFYKKLALWWERNNIIGLGQGPKNIAQNITLFVKEEYKTYYDEYLDALKYDIITLHERYFRPSYINWKNNIQDKNVKTFWRNDSPDSIIKKYIPDYKFTNWRNINDQYQIESFKNYFPDEKIKTPCSILFALEQGFIKQIGDEDFAFLKK